MKLFIVHNHFRPGGVRRLVEVAAPYLVRALNPRVAELALVGGEPPDATWLSAFSASVSPAAVTCHIEPSVSYYAEQTAAPTHISKRLRRFLSSLCAGVQPGELVVWAHNQGLGRNLLLTRELVRVCRLGQFRLILHHHDWWFDNRWQRWPELRRSGFQTLKEVAGTVFPSVNQVRAVAVNQEDTTILKRHFPEQAAWLPNPAEPHRAAGASGVRQARQWLDRVLGNESPVWLMPCRLVRRKNIAEGLLLARWLRPEAWLITTGGPSSAEEEPYARRLSQAAQRHNWKLRLGILRGDESAKPPVGDLIAASEAVLLTSLQEGFGFPYIEAVAARRPLLARLLPNMAPDLRKFGFRFPQSYEEIQVDARLFNWADERERQRALFDQWSKQLPRPWRRFVRPPAFLTRSHQAQAVPFSRLTLWAQLEVLAWPASESLECCARLNPRLKNWRARAGQRKLGLSRWPASATKWLSGPAYARRFSRLLKPVSAGLPHAAASFAAQEDFARARLDPDNLYPLLWSTQS